jgi:hypothetical protein
MAMKLKMLVVVLFALSLSACGDRVGSEKWCAKLDEKPKSEWTMEQAGDYTKYCVLGMDPAKWCEKMEEKDKGDWTAKEAADYAKNCVGRG